MAITKSSKSARVVKLETINREASKLWRSSGKPELSQAERERSAEFDDLRFKCAMGHGLGLGEYYVTLTFGTTGEPPRGI